MATVSEFLRDLYPFVKQQWFTAQFWEEWFIWAINAGLSYIYCYKSHRRDWQIRTEAIRADENWRLYWTTARPIIDVNNFWCGKKLECILEKEKERENCCGNKSTYCSKCRKCCEIEWCCCSVEKTLDMIKVSPWAVLNDWDYKISGWDHWMWWMFWNYVEAKMPKDICCWCQTCEQVYITYTSRFNPVKCPTDEIPLPDAYLPALVFAVASFTVMWYLTFRASDDASYLALCDRILDWLDWLQVNIPTKIRDRSMEPEKRAAAATNSAAYNTF